MQKAYKIVAHLIAAVVVIQAATVAWGAFETIGMLIAEQEITGPPLGGQLHGYGGMFLMPALALALLVISLIARSGLKWALWVLLAVIVQIALAFASIMLGASWIGALHGINAFVILALAEVAARSVVPAGAMVPASGNTIRPAA